MDAQKITVTQIIAAPVEKVWMYWTTPEHITQWNNASDDWYTPRAESNLQPGGRFVYRMEAKDGSFGFDFGGTYTAVEAHKKLEYTLDDHRKVTVAFAPKNGGTEITEEFEAETENTVEMQQQGWQAILNNFKKYTETH